MSSAPAVSSSPAPSPAAHSCAVSNSAAGISGLFLNLLSLNASTLQKNIAGTISSDSHPNTLDVKGSNFEPKLLVLPQGLVNLSESDLKSLLANAPINAEGNLNNQALISLTSGTPAAEAIKNFLSNLQSPTTLSVPEGTDLATTEQDATLNGKILLIATNLSPSDIEQLKKTLTEDGNKVIDIANGLDGKDATDTNAVTLVMFVHPPMVKPDIDTIVDGSDIPTSDSSTVQSGKLFGLSHHALGKYVSPFDKSDASGTLPESALHTSEQGDFKGSITNANEKTSQNANTSGKMDEKVAQPSNALFQEWNGDINSLITTDATNPLTGTSSTAAVQNSALLTNPVINNTSATGLHPATHTIAALLEKTAGKSEKSQQTLTIQLDPPELGRVQLQLSYEKGEAMKVHLLTETQDTLTLLQRDSHALRAALEQAGIQTDSSSLTFDMAGSDQSFNQMLGQFQDGNSERRHSHFSSSKDNDAILSDLSLTQIDTTLDFIPESATGTVRYSLVV